MSEQIEVRAREMGWKPAAEFNGDPGRWVDAETYVTRADTVLPIVKAEKAKLEKQLNATQQELREMREALDGSKESIKALEEFYTEETKRQVAQARRDLAVRIKAAREDDDVDAELELTSELSRLNAAEDRAKAAPTKKEVPKEVPLSAEYISWAKDNAWFNSDRRKTTRALVVAQELSEDSPELRNTARFYEELDKRLVAEGIKEGRSRASKVEGGSDDSQGQSGGGGASYEDLPADAKAACAKQAKALVGKDKQFKTEAEWRKYYASIYFKEY